MLPTREERFDIEVKDLPARDWVWVPIEYQGTWSSSTSEWKGRVVDKSDAQSRLDSVLPGIHHLCVRLNRVVTGIMGGWLRERAAGHPEPRW